MRNIAPWFVVLLAVLAISPAARQRQEPRPDERESKPNAEAPKAEAPKRPAPKVETPPPAAKEPPKVETCQPETGKTAPPHAWCEPLGVLGDFFGLERDPKLDKERSVKAILEAADPYKLEFMIALVPDPLESQLPLYFDTALDALQKGFADSRYRFDRFWLPWAGENAKTERLYRTMPGVLLLRKNSERIPQQRLMMVFLVGESPKSGIHKVAFHTALQIVSDLQGAAENSNVSILGPTFSGSVDSLHTALEDWRQKEEKENKKNKEEKEQDIAGGIGKPAVPLEFRIATGSATARGLEKRFQDLTSCEFCRTVVPDTGLGAQAFKFLASEMNWDLDQVVLLTEGDTDYGQSFFDESPKKGESEKAGKGLVLVRFPSHVSDVRNAWEKDDKSRREEEQKVEVGDMRLQTRRPALDLGLGDRGDSVDVIPNFSSLTTPAQDLELANVLETISREGIRYVGVLATDLKDKLFLIEKIRQSAPDTLVFTIDSNLLLAHPDFGESLDGVIVLTRAPLYTEGARWLPISSEGQGGQRRQFLSEFQQGTFEAVRYLTKKLFRSTPQLWVSVVANGSLWPIARLEKPLEKDLEGLRLCQSSAPPDPSKDQPPEIMELEESLAGKSNLQMIFFAGALCLLSAGLTKAGLLRGTGEDGKSRVLEPVQPALMLLGAVVLALFAGLLLVVGALPEWAPLRSDTLSWTSLGGLRPLFLASLCLVYGYLSFKVVRAARQRPGLLGGFIWLLFFALTLAVLVLIAIELWMPGERIELFYLRARAFSSGLSPMVSLALLGGAFYVWILCEVRRQWLIQRQSTDCPLESLCERSTRGCGGILDTIREGLERIFPREGWPWILWAGFLIPPVILLLWTIQPVAETKNYGRLFIVLLAAAASLAALSFYRFIRTWLGLHRILVRLDHASPEWAKTFEALSKDIGWKPMQSFGFRIPPFKMLVLSVRKLEALLAAGRLSTVTALEVEETLKDIFENEGRDLPATEYQRRRKLEQIFGRACQDLNGNTTVRGVREFLAVRIAAYLRYVFAHMRSLLIETLGMGLLILIAVTAYAFEPKQFVSLAIWLSLAFTVATTLWIFLQMDRNPTLSRIGGTAVGEVTLDKTFYTNFLLYIVVPVLGMIATQFPDVGRLLGKLANQLLQVFGGS